MRASEFVRRAVVESGTWSLARLARTVGVTPQAFNSAMNRDADMKAGRLAELADVLGWELVVVPKGSRLPNGAVRIDPTHRKAE